MFNKNLAVLDNPALKRRLEKIDINEAKRGVTYIITPSNDYILLKDDIPIDDLNDPRKAIQKHLQDSIKNDMGKNDFIIEFGIGLGYLLDETFNTYPSRIYIYEPDVELLRFVLSNVDISEHLASGRVYITNDLDELLTTLSNKYLSKDKIEIVYLQNYAVVKNKELLVMTQKVFNACKSKLVDINTISKFSEIWLSNTLNNIAEINNKEAYLLSDLENKFIGQTALVIGAGPSLNDNIERIKAHRNKFVIFAVNKAIKYLEQHHVRPDFVVCLDAGNMNKTLDTSPEYLYSTNCIIDVRVDQAIFKKGFKKIFVNISNTDFIINKLAKYNNIKFYESGGSASIMALVAAANLGFSKIVLVGVDLAFKDSIIYANGETMNRLSQDEILVDSVKKDLVQVPSINGGMVYTRADYETFIHQFEEVIKELEYTNIYNISTFGAQINGVRPVNFEYLSFMTPADLSILDSIQPFKFKMEEFIQDEFFNINNIISILSKEVFSPELISAIVKSVLVYQYMQNDVLEALQTNFSEQIAENFINRTKTAIKFIVDNLQKNKMV